MTHDAYADLRKLFNDTNSYHINCQSALNSARLQLANRFDTVSALKDLEIRAAALDQQMAVHLINLSQMISQLTSYIPTPDTHASSFSLYMDLVRWKQYYSTNVEILIQSLSQSATQLNGGNYV